MAYNRVNWVNEEVSKTTPINAENLNKMDSGIATLDEKVDAQETAIQGKADKTDVDAKVFIAEYNVTTAQEIIAHIDSAKEPFAPMLIRRGNDYYTVITAQKQAENKVIIRSFATLSGNYYVFMYTVTNGSWSSTSYGFQQLLESGTNIKTINNQSLIGSGNLDVSGGTSYDDTELRGRIGNVETALDGHTVAENVPSGAKFTDTVYDDTALAGRVTTVEGTIATKADASALGNYVEKDGVKVLSTNDYDNAEKAKVATAVQPDDIDKTVVTGETANSTASTVTLTEANVNLKTGTTGTQSVPLPVADATQAGVINAATYQAIQKAVSDIEAMSNASVSVSGLSANPTQAELTAAWQAALSTTDTPSNNAKIWETDNNKGWTYFSNTAQWTLTQSGTSATVSIDQFTNTSLGTIKGSMVDGQVHAEADGTGSVNGWDTVVDDVTDLKNGATSTQSAISALNGNIATINTNLLQLTADKANKSDVILDSALSLTSKRGVENQAISNALSQVGNLDEIKYSFTWNLDKKAIVIKDNSTGIEQDLVLTGLATLADIGSRI